MLEQASFENPQTAIVLAGGLGTRLRTVVSDRPKVLAPVAGKPFLAYLLSYLSKQGIRQVILSIGYLGEQVQTEIGDGTQWGVDVHYVYEKEPLGTGGAIKYSLQGIQGSFFAMNGDTLFQVSLPELWQYHLRKGTPATVSLRSIPQAKIDDQRQRGCVLLDADGYIQDFDEKPDQANTYTGAGSASPVYTNAGVYVLTPEALDRLMVGRASSLEREIFPALAAERKLAGCPQSGYFVDIGTPHSLTNFEEDVKKGVYKS